ncbi:DUF2806 domain-containing protein [Pantoea sp. ME81]|uniref:DUF2806 domain-containing protein n=1 Tax=Pantoea sp. ME81 TaxID=2743935 RepID=UPI0015F4B64B|nr:DUF2806 domain-containing protein [Pantoea sp. ME81]
MSLINIDLSGLSEPGVKLIEKLSDAVGAIYKPTGIRREAKAETEADKIRLLAKMELDEIEKKAVNRLLKKETKRQRNIEEISMQAAKNLQENDKVNDIDEDWLTVFFNECQDISESEIQSLWAKILSEEVKNKGSISKRAIRFISSIDRAEAELITKFGKYVWDTHSKTPILYSSETNANELYGLTFDELHQLESLGIILQNLGYSLTFSSKSGIIHYYGIPLIINFESTNPKEWTIGTGTAILTPLGVQILKLSGSQPDLEYLAKVIAEINKLDNITAGIAFPQQQN